MMNKNGSTRVIFLAVLAGLALIAAVSAFLSWQKEKGKRMSLEVELDDLQRRRKDLELTLGASRREADSLKNKLSNVEAERLSLNTQFEAEKSDKERFVRELTEIKGELSQVNDIREKTELELRKTKKELDEVKAKVNDLAKAKQKLEEKVKQFEAGQSNTVELGKVIISPKSQAKFDAQVITANKEYNFIVINLGQKDGFKTSDVFYVENRAGISLGKGYIEEAKEVMSVLSFAEKDMSSKLKEGERIILKVQ